MTTPVWRDLIRDFVADVRPYSFEDPQRIAEWGELFVEAHRQAPGGLSIELGTWRGGTASVCCRLLERLYPPETRPLFFTVDPYGMKPYNGGDADTRQALYGDVDYVVMKKLLARHACHVHYHMTGELFFRQRLSYWQRGEERPVNGLTFVLVDAEHDADNIAADVRDVIDLMAPGGIIVVDNIDNDPKTREVLPGAERRRTNLRREDGEPQEYAVVRIPAPAWAERDPVVA